MDAQQNRQAPRILSSKLRQVPHCSQCGSSFVQFLRATQEGRAWVRFGVIFLAPNLVLRGSETTVRSHVEGSFLTLSDFSPGQTQRVLAGSCSCALKESKQGMPLLSSRFLLLGPTEAISLFPCLLTLSGQQLDYDCRGLGTGL